MYEALKQETAAFRRFDEPSVLNAIRRDALDVLGARVRFSACRRRNGATSRRSDREVDVPQNDARKLDTRCRHERALFAGQMSQLMRERVEALVSVAVEYISKGAPAGAADTVHRIAKFDTSEGLTSLHNAADQHVPYAVLLYERYLGRPGT